MDHLLPQKIQPDREPLDLPAYKQEGGYQSVHKALLQMSPSEVTGAVQQSNLHGRGGAGFPTGTKWSIVPMGIDAPHPKYMIGFFRLQQTCLFIRVL